MWLVSIDVTSVGDAAAGPGLHFLHMSEGPFSHDAGHIMFIVPYIYKDDVPVFHGIQPENQD